MGGVLYVSNPSFNFYIRGGIVSFTLAEDNSLGTKECVGLSGIKFWSAIPYISSNIESNVREERVVETFA